MAALAKGLLIFLICTAFLMSLQACEKPQAEQGSTETTVLGIDKDNDGVRDDIQGYINRKYSGPFKRLERLAMIELARAGQAIMATDGKSKEAKVAAVREYLEAQDCLYLLFERPWFLTWSFENPETMVDSVSERIHDTAERVIVYLTASEAFGGESYQLAMKPVEVCRFDKSAYGWSLTRALSPLF